MKKIFLTLTTAAAIAACTAPLSVHASGQATLSPDCSNPADRNSYAGQWIVVNNGETVKEILQSLSEKCGLNLDFLFQEDCKDDPSADIIVPEAPESEDTQPELPESTPSVPETNVPDTQPPVSTPEDEVETTPSDTVHPYVLRIVELVNEERIKAGLNPVTLDTAASSAALIRSQEIVSSFSHTRPDGSSFSTALKEQGISYRRAGENIAWGQRSPEEVMEGWMNSSGHRANILGESFTHIGVGYYQENGVNYWTQLFYQ